MKLSGTSQAQIADQVGVPASHLNHFFRGKGDVRSGLFVEILNSLDIDIESLVNKKIAQLNDIELASKTSAGETFEKLVKSFERTEREAIIEYLGEFAFAHLGTKSKKQTKLLRELI